MSQTHVVILGAGVIGLTIAHVLTEDVSFKVTIVARDLPEDITSQGFASPWAGANWAPLTTDDRLLGWERHTFDKFWSMIPTGLVRKIPSLIYFGADGTEKAPQWEKWKGIVRDFRVLPSDHPLPPKARCGVQFDTFSVNPEAYLPWLKSQLEGRGVSFMRRRVISLDEAGELAGEGGVVINATSLGARSLLGVEDTEVYPIRGQVVLLHAPNINECIAFMPEDKNTEVTYLIPRASTPGMVLVGGTFQSNNWDTSLSIPIAHDILARAKEVVPALAEFTTCIQSHNVGLRPARKGGPRVEAQFVDLPSEDALVPRLSETSRKTRSILVVHAYGFGSAGYQQSWGAAKEAVRLLNENLCK